MTAQQLTELNRARAASEALQARFKREHAEREKQQQEKDSQK